MDRLYIEDFRDFVRNRDVVENNPFKPRLVDGRMIIPQQRNVDGTVVRYFQFEMDVITRLGQQNLSVLMGGMIA